MLVSGDREFEVRYLAEEVGITEIHAQKVRKKNSPLSPGNRGRKKRFTWGTASTTPRP